MPLWTNRRFNLLALLLAASAFSAWSAPGPGGKPRPRASRPIDPSRTTEQAMQLLQANCLACHNAEKHKGGLQLVSREAALKGGDDGPVLVPGKPAESLVYKLLSAQADPHMPPKKQLSTNQIESVRRWIAAGAPWDEAALLRAARPREVRYGPLPGSYHPVLALAVSPDGKRLAIGRGNEIFLHDLTATNFPLAGHWTAHRDVVHALAWDPEGKNLASGSFRELTLWSPGEAKPVWTVSSNLLGRVTALRFGTKQGLLIAGDSPSAQGSWIRTLQAGSGEWLAAWPAHADSIYDLALSADGERLASAGADKLVKIWDVTTRQEIAQIEAHGGAVSGVAFNTNATEIVSVGADKQLKVWDLTTRESFVTAGGKKHGFNAVAWSADGKRIVGVDEAGGVTSYTDFKRHTGEQSSSMVKETQWQRWNEPLNALALSAEAVFTGGQDGTVYALDWQGKLLAKLELPKPPAGSGDATLSEHLPVSQPEAGKRTSSPRAQQGRTDKTGVGSAGRSRDPRRGQDGPAPGTALADVPLTPSFVRDVLPVMARAGCMAGSCHAKAEGQNGFHLSVFSYDPKSDYDEIVKEARGRRIFPAAPEESLLLLKPTMAVEHGGGERFATGSPAYHLLRQWIRSGMIYQGTNEPTLKGIEVEPRERTYAKGAAVQLKVRARYSDDSTRDVTALAGYAANDKEIAQVEEQGLLRAGTLSGETVVVARYMGFVDAARVTVPADRTFSASQYARLPVRNFIDPLAYAQFRKLGILPSGPCTDAEFLRRSTLDAIGRLPTPEEARGFLADSGADKRARWIEHLLSDPGYGDYWANKWADLLRPNSDRVGVKSVFMLDQWLRQSFRENKPYDRFVREILLAEGSNHRDGPVVVYRDRREPSDLTTMFSQLFLGTRLECARCHHHPNEKWSQEDFYQFAAFFGPLKQKGAGLSPPISAGTETFYFAAGGTVKHPVTEAVMKPRPPEGPVVNLAVKEDPRRFLADWLTNPANPFFAKAAVNRVWAAFFGRGFVEPVDDFRASNPASNEPLLAALAEDFARSGYDFKQLIRTILSSTLYQLSSTPEAFNLTDTRNFSRSYRRRLPAEVLLDAVNDVTGVRDQFNGSPPESRALQTWSYKVSSQFMDAFGRPNSSSDCPCERDVRPSVVQALHMMNATSLQGKLSNPDGRVKKLAASDLTPEEIIRELYLLTYSRPPSDLELKSALKAYETPGATRQAATEDVLWALLNSPEFVFNH